MSKEEDLEKQIEDVDRKRREVNSRLQELGGEPPPERSFTETRLERPEPDADRSERPASRRSIDVRPPRELGGESVVSPGGTKRAASVQLDDKEKKRTKRLFGALVMGTLARTKKELDNSANTAQGKKRAEMEAKVAAKAREEREERRDLRRKENLERREEERKQRSLLAKEKSAKEFELLSEKWEQHRTNLAGYLRTKTEPPLFYRPAKVRRCAGAEAAQPLEGAEKLLEAQLAAMTEEAEPVLESARQRFLRPAAPDKQAEEEHKSDKEDEDEEEQQDEKPAEAEDRQN